MKFFAYLALAATASATWSASEADKEELFELWTAQMEAGALAPEVYTILAQALDGDMPADFFAENDSEEMPAELAEANAKWTIGGALGSMKNAVKSGVSAVGSGLSKVGSYAGDKLARATGYGTDADKLKRA